MKCRKIKNDHHIKQIGTIKNGAKIYLNLKNLGCDKRNALVFV